MTHDIYITCCACSLTIAFSVDYHPPISLSLSLILYSIYPSISVSPWRVCACIPRSISFGVISTFKNLAVRTYIINAGSPGRSQVIMLFKSFIGVGACACSSVQFGLLSLSLSLHLPVTFLKALIPLFSLVDYVLSVLLDIAFCRQRGFTSKAKCMLNSLRNSPHYLFKLVLYLSMITSNLARAISSFTI